MQDKRDRYNEGTLSFRMPLDEVREIVKFAERHDATVSWAIRQLVRAGMEQKAA